MIQQEACLHGPRISSCEWLTLLASVRPSDRKMNPGGIKRDGGRSGISLWENAVSPANVMSCPVILLPYPSFGLRPVTLRPNLSEGLPLSGRFLNLVWIVREPLPETG
jgi:hypothetical protein